jgi:GH15 family glucan-1,4-alpha-glucosidase
MRFILERATARADTAARPVPVMCGIDGRTDLPERELPHLADHWDQPDEGIWETRGGSRRFLYPQLMCWVAIERALRLANRQGLPGDLEH